MPFNLYKRLILFLFLTVCLLPIYIPAFLVSRLTISKLIMLYTKKVWSLLVLKIVGIKLKISGQHQKCLVYVSNHVSWIDILVLNALLDIVFVSKNEVKSWPGLGILAILAKTIFIERRSLGALQQKNLLERSLNKGQSLCFFPEGTSTDGLDVKPFKSSLFSICFPKDNQNFLERSIQPITLKYTSPSEEQPGFYSFWSEDDTIFGNIKKIIKNSKSGSVEIIFHEPLFLKNFKSRKDLSLACFNLIREKLIL